MFALVQTFSSPLMRIGLQIEVCGSDVDSGIVVDATLHFGNVIGFFVMNTLKTLAIWRWNIAVGFDCSTVVPCSYGTVRLSVWFQLVSLVTKLHTFTPTLRCITAIDYVELKYLR